MARRNKGRALSGWLIVDKPSGMSSATVVNKARWVLNANKAGHAGTLDPAATGLLAIAFGEATKTIPFITDAQKTYHFTVRWGAATNTDDAEGEVIARSDTLPDQNQIEAALPDFRGDIEQIPPQVSAVKIDGVRAYKRVRDGEDVEIAARPLHVSSLKLINIIAPDLAEFEMTCGKGGYVRSIARDLGEVMGCLGHVEGLRRTSSGPFSVSDAVAFDIFQVDERIPELDKYLLPVDIGLAGVARCICDASAAVKLQNGNPAPVVSTNAHEGETVWASIDEIPLAIGTYRAGMIHPNRVLNLLK